MSQKSACLSESKTFCIETVSFSDIPNQSRLFIDFQENSSKSARFYPEKQTDFEDIAEKVLENFKIDRNRLCDILLEENQSLGAVRATFENIELLRQNDCVAVVTGQQAGLFSGSLYTI